MHAVMFSLLGARGRHLNRMMTKMRHWGLLPMTGASTNIVGFYGREGRAWAWAQTGGAGDANRNYSL